MGTIKDIKALGAGLVGFYEGNREFYQSASYVDKLYFASNTGELLLNNKTYGAVVEDLLTSDSTTHALSANQGKVLKSLIDTIDSSVSEISLIGLASTAGYTGTEEELINKFNTSYLPLTGGTLTDNLTLSSGNIYLAPLFSLRDSTSGNLIGATSGDDVVVNIGNTNSSTVFHTKGTLSRASSSMNYEILDRGNFLANTDYVTPSKLTSDLGNYLPLVGGIMTGSIDLGGQNLRNNGLDLIKLEPEKNTLLFKSPTSSSTNLNYSFLLSTGDEVGEVYVRLNDGSQYKVYHAYNFKANTDYITPQYFLTQVANYLPLTGGILTGDLQSPSIITNNISEVTVSGEKGNSLLNLDNSSSILQIGNSSYLTNIRGNNVKINGNIVYHADNLTDQVVTSKKLTGLTSTTNSTIYETDSILQAFSKIKYKLSIVYTQSEINEMLSGILKYKGTKQTWDELPTATALYGDVWTVIESNGVYPSSSEFVWTGNSTWEYLGSIFQLTKESVETVLTGNITSHTHSYLPLDGGRLSGALTSSSSIKGTGYLGVAADAFPQIQFQNTGSNSYTSLLFTNILADNVKALIFRPDSTESTIDAVIYHSQNFVSGVNYVAPSTLENYVDLTSTQIISGYKVFSGVPMFGQKSSTTFNTTGIISDSNDPSILCFRLGSGAGNSIWRLQQAANEVILLGIQGRKAMKITSNASDISITADNFIGHLTGNADSATMATSLDPTKTYTAVNFSTSDIRLKTNIESISEETILRALQAVGLNKSFNYKASGVKGYGPIAQELEELMPELVYTNEDDVKGVNNIALLHLQIQGLLKEINRLKNLSN